MADSLAAAIAQGSQTAADPVLAEADCQAAVFHAAGTPEMRIDQVLPPIETLGPYRLIRLLGRGGMGAVYLAQHNRLRKKVAIKLLPRQHGFDAVWVGRFEREMQAVAGLSHPGIVTATDAGDVDGWHYLVMEYLDGLDLADLVRRIGPIQPGIAASIMRDVCDAIAAVHDAGLVHRDIKPSNIMLTSDGSVKLLDLGLVSDQHAQASQTTTVGHMIGTLAFAAPEQLSGDSVVDARADLYAVGATLFQLITGRTPHGTDRGIAPLVIAKTTQAPIALDSVSSDVPKELNDLVNQLLQRNPAERPTDAGEVAARLKAVAVDGRSKAMLAKARRVPGDDRSGATMGPHVAMPPKTPIRRGWKWIAAAAGSMGLLLLATVIVIELKDQIIRIETNDPDIKIAVQDIKPPVDAQPVVEKEPEPPKKVFKGKTLDHWTTVMSTERDVSTLIDAMMAVGSLIGEDDVAEAQSLLVAARRYGGWVSGSGGTSSVSFMNRLLNDVAPNIMPRPGIDAICNELAEGNEKSRAAGLFLIQKHYFTGHNFSAARLSSWASESSNQAMANQLHQNLRQVLRGDEMTDEQSIMRAKVFSLVLAIAMDKPLAEEPELREDIEAFLVNSQTELTVRQRLDRRWSEGKDPVESGSLSPQQWFAAKKLQIELPDVIAAQTFLLTQPDFRDERNRDYLERLKEDPREASDALLLNLRWDIGSNLPGDAGVQSQVYKDEKFWLEALPILIENSTRPDIVHHVLYQIEPLQNKGGGGMGGGSFNELKPSQAMAKLIQDAIKATEQRMADEGIIPNVRPAPAQSGGGIF